MRKERIWPNGLRYLWTDAFGVVLLVSLYEALRDERYLDEAEGLVAEVNRVLGRPRGIRIGEEPDREGQYFHYLAMWLYALSVLGRYRPLYREQGVTLARQIHDPFVVPGRGVIWKMQEDLSGPYPGYGFGALDAFDGYVSYRLLDEQALARPICRRCASPLPLRRLGGIAGGDAMPERVDALNVYFETYRSGDEYDRNAITHVMACSSHFPGLLLRSL